MSPPSAHPRRRAPSAPRSLSTLRDEAFDASPEAIVIGRPEGRVLAINAAAARLFGCTMRQALRLRFAGLFGGGDAPGRGAPAGPRSRPLPIGRCAMEARRPDGTAFTADIAFTALGRGRRAAVAAHVREADPDGPATGPGSLLARIGHELNNPLAIVVAQATMLHDLSSDPEIARRAERIVAAAQRAGRIVRGMAASEAVSPDAEPSAWRGADPRGADPRGTLSVLIVDDERGVADSLADVVALLGHEARVATSAAAALEAVGRCRFDAAFVDLRMPDLDGLELARAVAALDPGLAERVAIVTGDTMGRTPPGAPPSRPLLAKPFTLDAVRGVLARMAAP